MEKKQLKQSLDIGKLVAMFYVISPFSCFSQDNDTNEQFQQEAGNTRYSAIYNNTVPDEKKTDKEEKGISKEPSLEPSLYDRKQKPKVIVFSGHIQANNSGGAVSVTGNREYEYNDALVAQFREVESPLEYITHLATENIDLEKRPGLAEQSGAQVYLEIHHDSVDEKDVESAKIAGKGAEQKYGGFSLHMSPKWFYEETNTIAVGMRDCFVDAGMRPNTYHAKEDRGQMQAVEEGIYTRSGLLILNTEKIPTLLVEAGSIVVPTEEAVMRRIERREAIVQCIDATMIRYFEK